MIILHIARAADWAEAVAAGEYRVSSREATLAQEGFIHASTRHQVAATARRVWTGSSTPLVMLVMDDTQVRDAGTDVLYERAKNGQEYPHIYGPILPAFVREVVPVTLDQIEDITAFLAD
ncbi:DUF952 domain-containing protein [Glaciihabitans sp. dw_435]|uniref:DUF952 domain-containing protein n=1 Tax=Glaciihabitans sp. dw_435 TaxID=2720081 RepID=UPI001BD29AD9|nr:DUF952 domain-containing protein [Glaciihabitans sp. dw_435]